MSLDLPGFDEAAGAAAVEDLAAPEKGKGGEIDAAIQRILNCSSTDRADEAAIAFCYINSKGARKRLVLIPPLPPEQL